MTLQFRLLHVNHLAAGIQRAVHANLLAFELLDLVLVVDVVRGSRRRILQHVLVALFHDRTGERLSAGGVRCL